jgi:TatA/E family protein of Tat protein translocase
MEIFGIGPMELILVLIIALTVFGPDKLPEIGAKLGKAMRSMREATHEFSQEIEETRAALEAPLQDIRAPFQEASAAVQAISHPQQALREALLGEVNRADVAARQPVPVQEQAGAAALAATGAALSGVAEATLGRGQPVTENPNDDGAIHADQPASVPAAQNPEVATVLAEDGDVSAETNLVSSDAETGLSVNGRTEFCEAVPAAPSSAVPAPVMVSASVATAPAEQCQPAQAAATNFDIEEFVAVMQRVSRRLSIPDGKVSEATNAGSTTIGSAAEPGTAAPTAAEPPVTEGTVDEPAAQAPTSRTPETEDPQPPANPVTEE